MKATGVVRRIDELGRLVIPKEIRRTLRIREGESLEVFVDSNSIILKKYSIMRNIDELAFNLTDSFYSFLKKSVVITDNDSIIACSSNLKNKLINCKVSDEIIEYIKDRKEILKDSLESINLTDDYSLVTKYVLCPVVSNSDCVGLVLIFDEDRIADEEMKMCMIASKILSKAIEE